MLQSTLAVSTEKRAMKFGKRDLSKTLAKAKAVILGNVAAATFCQLFSSFLFAKVKYLQNNR